MSATAGGSATGGELRGGSSPIGVSGVSRQACYSARVGSKLASETDKSGQLAIDEREREKGGQGVHAQAQAGGEAVPTRDYWVPITEAALRIGVHRRTIMRWCSSGKLGGNAMRTPGWYWYVRDSWIRGFGRFVGGAANEASA